MVVLPSSVLFAKPENAWRGLSGSLPLGGLVGVEFVGARLKVLRGRSMLGGAAAFVFGGELLLFGAGGSLVRGRGLPVGFALGSGRVASGLRGLAPARFGLGLGTAWDPEQDRGPRQCDDANDDQHNGDSHTVRIPAHAVRET